MIWNKDIECSSRKGIKAIQLERLKATFEHVTKNVPFYTERLKEHSINSLEDLKNIPFTTKEDLRVNYPYNLFAVPMKEIVRIHASSGTTGKPTVVGYTKSDLDMWSECVARIVCMAGATDEDVAQISFGYGLFTGALGLHYGLEKVGASVIPVSSGNTEKQMMIMKDFLVTTLISTPSYALYMSDVAMELGIEKNDLSLKYGLFGAEGHTTEMNLELEKRWGILATENYGLSEVVGPGVSGECRHKNGLHINEDCFLPEIIDPDTGKVLDYGEEGELVITTINKKGLPLLRYRTKDITTLYEEQCACGRTSLKMAKVKGRTDDMLIIKGVNVYPSQIEGIIVGMSQVSPYYQIIVSKKGFVDQLELQVELHDSSLLEKYSELEKVEKEIRSKIHTILGLDCKVTLRERGAIERTTGKAKRVVDLRKEQ